MIRNYLKTAFRSLSRNLNYAFINIIGLAIGIAACILIFLVVQFESSFDAFHKKRANIYRIVEVSHNQDGLTYSGGIAFPTAAGIRTDFPEIKEVVSIFQDGGQISVDNGGTQTKKLAEDNFYYTDPGFFDMFNFGWLAGNPVTSLKDPNSAVLTQATAEKLFGDWKLAIGKVINFNNKTLYTVTGILQNIPPNSDFPLSVVVPYSAIQNSYVKGNLDDWISDFDNAYTFVLLPPELSPATFNKELISFAKRHKPAEYTKVVPVAQPLSEMHYDERFGNYNNRTFSHSLINALSLIGVFLILIACVNFINLATAQSITRSKEVGVRKVLGSSRAQLGFQFLGETTLIVTAAVVLAIVFAGMVSPYLSKLLEVKIAMSFTANSGLVVFLLVITLLTILLSGIYPAAVLSGFKPATALKSNLNLKMAGDISLRRLLVIFQFAIAQVLIICMLTVVSQMDYFKNASLGFNKAAVINVNIPGDSTSHSRLAHLHDDLLRDPDIRFVSFSFGSPSSESNWNSNFKFDHASKSTNFGANLKWADPDYFKTFDIQFVAGRPYYPSDTAREFVVNETLLAKLGIRQPGEAIGKQINLWDNTIGNIVGVVRDFNAYSLHKPMAPVILTTWKRFYQTINIKIRPGTEKTAVPYIEKLWTSAFPDYVFDYKFLEESIANFYKQENQLSLLYKVFAGIAIFISCLGLYGLVSFMAVRRTKEIGVRKVLGASPLDIMYLLSREFTLLIVLAFALSAPIAYYLMHGWLQNFWYHIHLGAFVFLLAIISSILVAWLTVGHRALKSALANPVKSIRME
jgi:putative ABC transport system permease protein